MHKISLGVHNFKIEGKLSSLLAKSMTEAEIAQELSVDLSTTSRDVKALRELLLPMHWGLEIFITMNRLSTYQRAYLKQLVIECEVQRLTRDETLAFVNSKMKMGLFMEYIDYVRANIKHNVESRLSHLRKHRSVFISEFFNRDEIKTYQKHLWKTMNDHSEDGNLQKSCISELHQLTITLHNLYELLPAYSGSQVYAPLEKQNNAATSTEDPNRKFGSSNTSNSETTPTRTASEIPDPIG